MMYMLVQSRISTCPISSSRPSIVATGLVRLRTVQPGCRLDAHEPAQSVLGRSTPTDSVSQSLVVLLLYLYWKEVLVHVPTCMHLCTTRSSNSPSPPIAPLAARRAARSLPLFCRRRRCCSFPSSLLLFPSIDSSSSSSRPRHAVSSGDGVSFVCVLSSVFRRARVKPCSAAALLVQPSSSSVVSAWFRLLLQEPHPPLPFARCRGTLFFTSTSRSVGKFGLLSSLPSQPLPTSSPTAIHHHHRQHCHHHYHYHYITTARLHVSHPIGAY